MGNLLNLGATQARLLIAFVMIILSIMAIIVMESIFEPSVSKLFLDFGSERYPFSIQNAMWIMFFVGLGEIFYRLVVALSYSSELQTKLLPEDENSILTKEDMPKLFKKVKFKSKRVDDVASLIKSLVSYFQINMSISQAHELLNSQMNIKYGVMDSQYSMIRYITWVIPTLGFIGTVMGISLALAYAGDPTTNPSSPTFLSELTSKLGVAFDTTFVALIMSAILVFLLHIIQSYEEEMLTKIENYCLDNFLNKLYVN